MMIIPEKKKNFYENYTTSMDKRRLKELEEYPSMKKLRARQICSRDRKHEKNLKIVFKKT